MLRKLRRAMGDRDRAYWLSGLVELDDAFIGGKRPGKRGRGAEGRSNVLFAVEPRDATYLHEYVDEFVYRFNRRFWESQLPHRLLEAAVSHVPVPLRAEAR